MDIWEHLIVLPNKIDGNLDTCHHRYEYDQDILSHKHIKIFSNINSMHDTSQEDEFSFNQYDGRNIEHDEGVNLFHFLQ